LKELPGILVIIVVAAARTDTEENVMGQASLVVVGGNPLPLGNFRGSAPGVCKVALT
jgi:hypothetical protein